MSRRAADDVIATNRVRVNGASAEVGQLLSPSDYVELDGTLLKLPMLKTIKLNKPVGYVCSRDGQGSKTIYDLLPAELHHLKPIGRLDKDSSGLLLLTNDGKFANDLTHPSKQKKKVYEIILDRSLTYTDAEKIRSGVELEDGISSLGLEGRGKEWTVSMSEGRNRQIRRTFEFVGYEVVSLHRTQFGNYSLGNLEIAKFSVL